MGTFHSLNSCNVTNHLHLDMAHIIYLTDPGTDLSWKKKEWSVFERCRQSAIWMLSVLDTDRKKSPEHQSVRPLFVLLIIQFIISCIKSPDSNNEARWQWQLAVKAEEGVGGHVDDNVRLCKNMLGCQHSRHLGLTHHWAWFQPSRSKC